ncbi:MAG: hypothetical protein ACYC2I_02675 [Elusimicrobiales bacterium]
MRSALAAAALLLPSAAFAAGGAAPRNYFLEFYILHILGIMALLSLASERAEKAGCSAARIQLAWNWGLLLTFAACCLTGLGLFLPLGKPTAKLLFKLHVWTGAACCWAGLYHAARRMRAMLPSRRPG